MPEAQPSAPFNPPPAQTAHIRRKMLDVAYAPLSPAQKLDIYWPDEGSGPFPVILAIHGGGWMYGDKGDAQIHPMLPGLARGYAVVSINYRLSDEAHFPAQVHDAGAAVRWLRANAARLMLDPGKIAAWGASAGGHLACLLGVSAGVAALEDLSLGNPHEAGPIQAVVDWYGPTDLLKMDEQLAECGFPRQPGQGHCRADSPESLLIGAHIVKAPERVQAANPESYLRPGLPPFLIQHGDQDETVPCLQSIHLAQKLSALLGPERVALDILAGARHVDPAFETPENLARVFAFLDRFLVPGHLTAS